MPRQRQYAEANKVNIVIAEGGLVVARVTMFATHTGELNFGYPASDRQVIACSVL
jgi:hypothetical protein